MQISINVPDENIASKILTYLKEFKREEVAIETVENSFDAYQRSEKFKQDRSALNKTLKDIKSKKISLTKIDKNFWNNMDKVIESA